MANERFFISATNPNCQAGGGGCACGELANPDQQGPYAVFMDQLMDNALSPHLVVCAPCLTAATAALDGEIGQSGEDDAPDAADEVTL